MTSLSAAGAAGALAHPRLDALLERARAHATRGDIRIGLVQACDALALEAAARIAADGLGRPVLLGPRAAIHAAAAACGVDVAAFELIDIDAPAAEVAQRAVLLARDGALHVLMKGALHTDQLMAAIVSRSGGLRGQARISHAFIFDLPRYPKLLALADCVVNISPDLHAKADILGNAVDLLRRIGIDRPKVAIVAAVETVNPAIGATLDAKALVDMAAGGAWPNAIVEGPFGFDNAISAEAARIKKIDSRVSGDADLLVMPELNAGNMLYKSFIYIGGGECAGLVLGTRVPVVLTSRADSLYSRLASIGLAVLASPPTPGG